MEKEGIFVSREKEGYREILQDILEFSSGRRMLSIKEVSAYTGIADYRAIKKRFAFEDSYISAFVLARALAGGAQS